MLWVIDTNLIFLNMDPRLSSHHLCEGLPFLRGWFSAPLSKVSLHVPMLGSPSCNTDLLSTWMHAVLVTVALYKVRKPDRVHPLFSSLKKRFDFSVFVFPQESWGPFANFHGWVFSWDSLECRGQLETTHIFKYGVF